MNALPRLSALGFALALAGCDSGSDSKADAPPSASADGDENEGEKSARADEAGADDEPEEAGADDSGGPDDDLYAPFVDESRRARRPDDVKPLEPAPAKPSRGKAAKDKPPVTAEALGGDGVRPSVKSNRDSSITTPDGKTLKATKGGTVSLDRLHAHPR